MFPDENQSITNRIENIEGILIMVWARNRITCALRKHWIVLSIFFCSLPASGFEGIGTSTRSNIPGGREGFAGNPITNENNYGTSGLERKSFFKTSPALRANSKLLPLPRHQLMNGNAEIKQSDRLESTKKYESVPNSSTRLSIFGRGELVLGSRRINTPHLTGSNPNIVANPFKALAANYKLTEALNLSAYYIDEIFDLGRKTQPDFLSLTRPPDGQKSSEARMAAAFYDADWLNGQAWYYRIEDIENIFYVELNHAGALSQAINYKMGVQFDWAQNPASDKLREVDSQTLGVIGSVDWENVTVFAAHNHELGKTPPLTSFTEGPFFTSMYDQTNNSIGDKTARSTTGGFVYAPSIEYLKGLEFGVSGGWFRTADRETYDVIETDYSLNYGFSEGGSLELAYAYISDKISTEDYSQLSVVFNYVF